jgi:voltage-gated potassium channel Kch
MVTVPAFVWRGGFGRRALILGGGIGVVLALLAWLDSGMLLSAIIVLLVTGLIYGVWLPRRMARYWPSARQLSGEQRVTVVDAARRGKSVRDPALAQAVIDYARGLHAAVEQARPFRWVLPLVLVVGVGVAVWDAVFGSWGSAAASVIYLAALLVEVFWWPKRRDHLLANADRAAGIAGPDLVSQ